MLAEWLMERHGWRDVWYLGSNGLRRGPLRFLGPDACYAWIKLLTTKPNESSEKEKYD